MNPFDILIVIILLYCLIRGIFCGLVREVAAIAGVLTGLWAAFAHYRMPAHTLRPWVADPVIANILGFVAIFAGVWGAAVLLGVLIRHAMDFAWLKWVDRICGAVFGLLKGVLIAAILTIVSTAFLPPEAPLVRGSRLAPYVTGVSAELVRLIPKDVKRAYGERIRKFESQWKKTI